MTVKTDIDLESAFDSSAKLLGQTPQVSRLCVALGAERGERLR